MVGLDSRGVTIDGRTSPVSIINTALLRLECSIFDCGCSIRCRSFIGLLFFRRDGFEDVFDGRPRLEGHEYSPSGQCQRWREILTIERRAKTTTTQGDTIIRTIPRKAQVLNIRTVEVMDGDAGRAQVRKEEDRHWQVPHHGHWEPQPKRWILEGSPGTYQEAYVSRCRRGRIFLVWQKR